MYKVKMDGYILYHPHHPSTTLSEPILELEPGYAGVFQATIPYDNPLYDKVYCRKSMISVYRDDKEIFYGEVRKIPKVDRLRNKQIYCTGALSFLADSIQPQAEYHDISPATLLGTMLDIHNSQVEERKQIHLGIVTVTDSNNSLYRYTNYETTLEAIRDKLIDRLGGYLRLRHEDDTLFLDWVSIEEYGNYSTQPIEFGLNLLDYSETTSAEDVVTALIPLGAVLEGASEIEALDKRVDITSVNDGKNYVSSQEAIDQFGWVWATNTWDDVTLPKNLLSKAREWLTTTQFETMSLQLTAADLSELGQDYDAFAEGDRIHCRAKPYGMDIVLPIMKLTIPLQNPAGRTLELSSHRQKTYTSQQSAVKTQLTTQQTEIASVANRNMQQSIDRLTSMVTGVNGGYKLTEYDESGRWIRDLYMNAPDKLSASHLLQISKDGISVSKNGYEGPYTIGITINGQILGAWIAQNAITSAHLSKELRAWIQSTDDGINTGVDKNSIISAINLSAEEATILASKLNLTGAIDTLQLSAALQAWVKATDEAIKGKLSADNIISAINLSAEEATILASKLNLTEAIDAPQLSAALQAWIKATDEGIATKLSQNGVIAAINSSEEDAAIGSDKLNLNGACTANENVQIDADGAMTAKSIKLIGSISTMNDENPGTFYDGVSGSFDFGTGVNYRFVNGLLVETILDEETTTEGE
jgi:hypothetical protein